jgi:hypothetical protein
MKIGKCRDCGEIKELTKHSEIGHHIPPYIRLCKECHLKRHGIRIKKFKKPNTKFKRYK